MKISKLNRLTGVFFALVLGTTISFSQGKNYMNSQNIRGNGYCYLNGIDNLSEKQKAAIQDLSEKHRSSMAELREKRFSESDPDKKSGIRTEMLESILAYRDKVKSLLTPEQQKQFDLAMLEKEFRGGGRNGMGQGYGNRHGWRKGPGRSMNCCMNSGCDRNRGGNGNGFCKSL